MGGTHSFLGDRSAVAVNVVIVDLTIRNRSILIAVIGVLIIVRSGSPQYR